ncbi:hypothetical protein M8J76_000700 [Diaphorina citri]|nr:hypothetical protein M8J76_000700 [Diaphorina citri]
MNSSAEITTVTLCKYRHLGSDESHGASTSSATSWEEECHQLHPSSGSEHEDLSSDVDSESNKSMDGGGGGQLWTHQSTPSSSGAASPQGKLARWFSMRRGSQYNLNNPNPQTKMPLVPEVEEETNFGSRRLLPPSLPPPPPHLSTQELKSRHIVAAIVQSENSYLATLHRLVNDYKKPLEEASPSILSSEKIRRLFHKLPEILQCHTLFRIGLSEAVANWDRDHKIGDVFVASFSKSIVLEIYSEFINNFSAAMDVARGESKKKPALAEFFKSRQNSSMDRLSFFGLMVKPDLLNHTGHGHPDRMSLQLALTQLESLAELLNERKREAEQTQAFKDILKSISGKLSTRPLADVHRVLLRQDDVTQLDMNQAGHVAKYKPRRLLLLNDLLVCVSVNEASRLTLKWSCPISDVQVMENMASPTLSRLLHPIPSSTASNNIDTSAPSERTDKLCQDISNLMHDYELVSRIAKLVGSLKQEYQDLNSDSVRNVLSSIQCEIQRKDEQMSWVDSCCLQLRLDKTVFAFQMDSPEARKEWTTELRLARLALDPNNYPAWEVPESENRPSNKMPLFVASHPLTVPHQKAEVVCGCFYTSPCAKQSFLWVCMLDGDTAGSVVSVIQTGGGMKPVASIALPGVEVTALEYVRSSHTVWMGTNSARILIYSASDLTQPYEVSSLPLPQHSTVVTLKQHCDNVFVALDTGSLLLYRRCNAGQEPEVISLGEDPVSCLLPINLSMYAACGKHISVLNAITGELQKSFTIQREHVGGNVSFMAHSGVGLWLSLTNSTTICLYHTETFKHLQDINVASNVGRMLGGDSHPPVCVTALMACKGLLWVGTDVGISLTVPLPRLEGVPIISGRVNIAYHAHTGPVRFLLALQDSPTALKRLPTKALACDIYGLYGELMYIKDYETEAPGGAGKTERAPSQWSLSSSSESGSVMSRREMQEKKEYTLVTVLGGQGYVNYQQPCCTRSDGTPHLIVWELKL